MLGAFTGGYDMIGKLIWPVIACVLLAGCMTGYRYRSGYGDYYYGQPDVDYRYHGRSYYGYGYWPYRGYSPYGYGGYYGFSRYYGYPYYPRYYYRSHYGYGHHDYDDDHDDDYVDNNDDPPRGPDVDDDDSLPPWRDFGDVHIRKSDPLPARRIRPQVGQARQAPAGRTPPRRPVSRPAPRPSPPPSISIGSRSSSGSSDRDTRGASVVRRPQRPSRTSDERREQ